MSLFPAKELNVKDEGWIGRDEPGETTRAIGIVGRACQLGALALGHLGDALVPALDHLALAEFELEHLATIARWVELGAIRQRARVVDLINN